LAAKSFCERKYRLFQPVVPPACRVRLQSIRLYIENLKIAGRARGELSANEALIELSGRIYLFEQLAPDGLAFLK
jgi:hypothetical protein